MTLLTKIKTAMTVAIIAGTLGLTTTVSAHNHVESYLDALVDTQIKNTQMELHNQTQQQVLNTSYRFEPTNAPEQALIAKVTVSFLTDVDALNKAEE